MAHKELDLGLESSFKHKFKGAQLMSNILFKCHLILISLLISSNLVFAGKLTKEQKILDFQYLISHIKSSYGPLEYKTKKGIVNIDRLIRKFNKKIKYTKTNSAYYYTIREFISSFKDGHFSATIPTRQKATLPFSVEWVNGRYLIHNIRTQIPGHIQLKPGDELLKINNKSVKKIAKHLGVYVNQGSNTKRRWTAWLLAVRPGAVLPVPSGKVILRVKLKASNNIVNIHTQWTVTGEFFDEQDEYLSAKNHFQSLSTPAVSFNPVDDLSIDKQLAPLGELFGNFTYMCNSSTRVAIPENATIIMKRPFVAYYYPTKKGNVGYLRLPHYSFDTAVLANYAYAIDTLEKNTEVLVIDQDHNCGGSVSTLGNLVGLLIDRPVENAMFQLVANKHMYMSLKAGVEKSNPNILGFSMWKDFLAQVKKAWLAGKHLTPKISLQTIYPNAETRYTKPILVLADELSGSGGDAFPALMQGYKRATILGTTTSGLGGSVSSIPSLPFSQIQVNLTRSLFFHPNGTAIENNGVTPDIFYRITESDFLNGYVDYREFYTQKALELL